MSPTEERVRGFLITELAADAVASLRADEPLFESVLDSTSIVVLVGYLEQCFQVEILDSEVVPSNFNTLGRICAFLDRKTTTTSPLSVAGA